MAWIRGRDVTLVWFAEDFGFCEVMLSKWFRVVVEDGVELGVTGDEAVEIRGLKRRNRLLGQETEVLRWAAADLFQVQLPGRALLARE